MLCCALRRRRRSRLGITHGGAISGEHGVGTEKLEAYKEVTNPVQLKLEASIKAAFDPQGLLNPGRSLTIEEYR